MSERMCFVCKVKSDPWHGGPDYYLCETDTMNVARTVNALLGVSGSSSDEYGVQIDWNDAVKLIQRITRNPIMRTFEIATERRMVEDLRDIDRDVIRAVQSPEIAS